MRSIAFTAILLTVGLLSILYVLLAIPSVQNFLREQIQSELSNKIQSRVEIGNLSFSPVNELLIEDVNIFDQANVKCLEINRLGAGINLWCLLFTGKFEITYVELVGFNANLYQSEENAPLNIDFILQAFSSKEKNKPTPRFDLKVHNIVIRGGTAEFNKKWKPVSETKFDINHLKIRNLNGDITLPVLTNDKIVVDLRRLSLEENSGFQLKDLHGYFTYTPKEISVKNLFIALPQTQFNFSDLVIPPSIFKEGTMNKSLGLKIRGTLTPSNFSAFYPPLSNIDKSFPFNADVNLDENSIFLNHIFLGDDDEFNLNLNAEILNYRDHNRLTLKLTDLQLNANGNLVAELVSDLAPGKLSEQAKSFLTRLEKVEWTVKGDYQFENSKLNLLSEIHSQPGNFLLDANLNLKDNSLSGIVNLNFPNFDLQMLSSGNIPAFLTNANVSFEGVVPFNRPIDAIGSVDIGIEKFGFKERSIENIKADAIKTYKTVNLAISVDDDFLAGNVTAEIPLLDGISGIVMNGQLNKFDSYSAFITNSPDKAFKLSGEINADLKGRSIDDVAGSVWVSDFMAIKPDGKSLLLDHASLDIKKYDSETPEQTLNLESDLVSISLTGNYVISRIPAFIQKSLHRICPAVLNTVEGESECGYGDLTVNILQPEQLNDFFNLSVFPLMASEITGSFDSRSGLILFQSKIPYLLQGSNKLITDTYLNLEADGKDGVIQITAGTTYPTKKGLLKIDSEISGQNGDFNILIKLNEGRDVMFYGDVMLNINLKRDPVDNQLVVASRFFPTSLYLNDATWKIADSEILYTTDYVKVDDFSVRHDDQYVIINGSCSSTDTETLSLVLSGIDLDYLFETLNIPHVNFGGTATGEIFATRLFNTEPIVKTRFLEIDNFSYNGSYLGSADITSSLNLPDKKISINAIISEENRVVAKADGGVWFGRDSLAFDFDADKVNIGFMQPFMSAFSSDVKGKASGKATLYGTFSDIDMKGVIAAENAEILIDYINARYTGSDTVYLSPGRIEIPHFKVTDKLGNTAVVEGLLTHRCFHEPVFNFVVRDMDNLLVYDTNSKINPLWYGTIFVSGYGEITGRPGLVKIGADVITRNGSDFTFVLSDQLEAVKSSFLTFTDKRREAEEAKIKVEAVPKVLERFQKTNNEENQSSDVFDMDFRVSVTDDVKFNLIMDPVAGDKIVAYGTGAMTMTYTSLTDELKLYGKYVLDKGLYNFSLQDIILKEFIIKPGSSIAFTGNPYAGVLDITAAYKVNTSLTELDSSFANDRDLNRTSVPVEALLIVTGNLTSPNIDFDIELPTVTEETSRKVKSIISTDDMMSRQVLYLVALNKFYPPEYMSTSNSGGEWASIASSTISSQLQNVIGQITDKFNIAPSIRSDKGDFSDIEVDLALSSQFFNNRLLINGNIGYRDPSNSSTTFVGDFDLEYLLNRKGTWRLKAYNHFNDQNYYLKSSLTTQGLGILWRKEFGLPSKKEETETLEMEIEN